MHQKSWYRGPMALAIATLIVGGCAAVGKPDPTRAAEQVRATESAFASTMADRDIKAFTGYLSRDAIFFGDQSIKHGPAEIAAAWQQFFTGGAAPFSWEPDHVEVLPSADLALSTGPVYVDGKVVGRFNSIWRLEARDTWRIVFDKGESVCAPPH